jgi:hypothetical protein
MLANSGVLSKQMRFWAPGGRSLAAICDALNMYMPMLALE